MNKQKKSYVYQSPMGKVKLLGGNEMKKMMYQFPMGKVKRMARLPARAEKEYKFPPGQAIIQAFRCKAERLDIQFYQDFLSTQY